MPRQTNAERGREVRVRLIAAAQELIAEIGWNAVSTRLLAERAGIRSGLVHYHFESLQALLRQAAVEGMRPLLEGAAAGLDAAPDPADAVEALLVEVDRYTGADPASLLVIEAYLAATRDPDLRDQMRGLMDDFRTHLTAALARAGRTDPEDAATLIMAAIDGLLLHKSLDARLSAARLAPLLHHLARPSNGAAQ
ncbi:TetR family transcriptional regulator [Glycomyces sp. NPDC049804]|uniref:TetR/AcrR family transcriptional regulator n=1 Tax=Glycomyces sp. NPDC049804 TaxID=3154363 RepID=UPI00343204F8